MSYHYLQEQAVDCLGLTYSVGGQSDTSNGTTIVNKLSPPESETVSCPLPPSLQTCVSSWSPVPLNSTEDLQTWLQGVSPANHSASPGNEPEQTTSAICGLQHGMSSAWLDPATAFLKTFQACLIADTSEPSLETWPKAGIVCGGEYYPPPSWGRRINEIGSGLWPTPRSEKIGGYSSPVFGPTLEQAVKMWPTPRVFMYKDTHTDRGKGNLGEVVGGQLNPTWVEWLMGWPLGWTDLKPLAMDKWRQWLEQHGNCCLESDP
jgi:hypothetical protein